MNREEKLLVADAGYLELYDFTNLSYHDLNRKQQACRQISAVLQLLVVVQYASFCRFCLLPSHDALSSSASPAIKACY